MLRAAGRLADPDSGVLLERLQLALGPEGIRMEADAISVRAGSPPAMVRHPEGAREPARRALLSALASPSLVLVTRREAAAPAAAPAPA